MKKNALLTFIFACVPGAGQMYYGYMKRGLSLASMFALAFGVLVTLRLPEVMVGICGVLWMYSFFDTYDLIRYAAAGQPKEDALLLFDEVREYKKYLPRYNRLLGWVLVALGAYGLYALVVEDLLYAVMSRLIGNGVYRALDAMPGVLFSLVLVAAGLWLLGLRPPKRPAAPEDLPPYPQDVPPAPQDVPPAPQDVPPASQDVPPAPQDVPPALQDVPPALQDVPPALQDTQEA